MAASLLPHAVAAPATSARTATVISLPSHPVPFVLRQGRPFGVLGEIATAAGL